MASLKKTRTSRAGKQPGFRFSPSVLALAGVLALPGAVSAATNYWIGAVDSDWFKAGNWSNSTVPTAAESVIIQIGPQSSGPAIVSGGAAFAESVNVGVGPPGTLAITNGGTLHSDYGNLANLAGSSGTVLVNGAGSSWLMSGVLGILSVGNGGTGKVAITNGGLVSNSAEGRIGFSAGSNGTVTVDNVGSTWNSGTVTVGSSGTGTLDVTRGGLVQSGSATIGRNANGIGTVTVDGVGSAWNSLGSVAVGGAGNGTLIVKGGGQVSGSTAKVGEFAGSTGTVTVQDVASKWANTSDLYVGYGGSGTLAVSKGATVTDKLGFVGSQAGSTGVVTVSGAGSAWVNGSELYVGDQGNGTMVISSGGYVSNSTGHIGNQAGSMGTVVVDGTGSAWTNNGRLEMGSVGTGELSIVNGGVVTSWGGYLGNLGTGVVTVKGPGSSWVSSDDLFVGYGNIGTLMVSSGGTVSGTNGYVGSGPNSQGTATIDGVGSTWNSSANLFVGHLGTGTLSILNGGKATSVSAYVGNMQGATGTVHVEGAGSQWANSGNLFVGHGGTGTLTVANGGLVTNLSGYVGNQAGATGSVNIDGAGSQWANLNTLFVGNGGNGTLTIAHGGMVSSGNNVTIASQAGSIGTLNIGGAVGAPAVAPGILSAPAILFGAGTGTLNFNHSDLSTAYNFSIPLVGAGTLNQNAGWTNLLEDSSLFTGPTHVNGGRLVVYGGLHHSLFDVNSGGTLGGNGYVGGTIVNAGGAVAPGTTGIGTLNVVGNIRFSADSLYQVDVSASGASDKILAETATLRGGTVQVLASLKGGTYKPSTSYTIVSTTGGVTGTFAGATANLAYLNPTLSYDPNNVYLTLTRNHATFGSVATNALQRSTAASVESLARVESSSSPVYQAVVALSAPQARAAFDQLSGEVHASARGVQLENSHLTRDVSLERLRSAGNEDMGNDGGGASEEGSTSPRLLRSLREPSFWTRAMGSWGTMDGNGAASVKRDSSGFMMGADTRVGEEGRFGLMGGYGRSSFDASQSSASGSSDNYTVGAYGGTRWGELALRGGAAYTWQDVSTRRTVAFPGFVDSLQADYKANTTQLFAELGWRIKREQAEFEPFVNLSHVNASTDGFTERGGAASLASGSNSSSVTFSTLGVRASTKIAMAGGADVTARGTLGWRHAFGDTAPATAATFAGSSAFEITGAPVARSVGVVEAGLDFRLTNTATLGITYGGQFGSGLKEHSARVQLNVAF